MGDEAGTGACSDKHFAEAEIGQGTEGAWIIRSKVGFACTICTGKKYRSNSDHGASNISLDEGSNNNWLITNGNDGIKFLVIAVYNAPYLPPGWEATWSKEKKKMCYVDGLDPSRESHWVLPHRANLA